MIKATSSLSESIEFLRSSMPEVLTDDLYQAIKEGDQYDLEIIVAPIANRLSQHLAVTKGWTILTGTQPCRDHAGHVLAKVLIPLPGGASIEIVATNQLPQGSLCGVIITAIADALKKVTPEER